MEIGRKHVLVIPSSLTLAGFAKFSAPTSFDTEYNLQPLVEPCCLRVTILTRKYFDSTRFAYMRFPLSSSHALLEMKCDMQISYEMACAPAYCVPLIHPVVNPNIRELTHCHNLIHFEHPNLSFPGPASPGFLQTLK